MKAVIDGKLYDTENAKLIGAYSSPHNASDFESYMESLYKTVNGRFFLAGEGNAMSPWCSDQAGGNSGPGQGIRALKSHEALEWCEAKDIPVAVIGEHFEIENA